jgi:hypothetical protein
MGKICMATLPYPYSGGRAVYCGGVVDNIRLFTTDHPDIPVPNKERIQFLTFYAE